VSIRQREEVPGEACVAGSEETLSTADGPGLFAETSTDPDVGRSSARGARSVAGSTAAGAASPPEQEAPSSRALAAAPLDAGATATVRDGASSPAVRCGQGCIAVATTEAARHRISATTDAAGPVPPEAECRPKNRLMVKGGRIEGWKGGGMEGWREDSSD
jgi:hypothetical protein